MYIFRISYLSIMVFCWILVSCSAEESEVAANAMDASTSLLVDEPIELTPEQFAMADMKLAKPEWREFPEIISANGLLEVPINKQASVSARVGGYAQQVQLVPGHRVRKGQVLFYLENPAFIKMQEEYLEASEKRKYLQVDFERQQTLANENIASEKNLLEATSDFRIIEAKCASLKAQLALINIDAEQLTPQNLVSSVGVIAPISGYLTAVDVVQGMFLDPGHIAVEIADTDQLEIVLDVFEKDIMAIKEGQAIFFSIPNAKVTTVFEAKVRHIEQALDLEKRVVHVSGFYSNTNENNRLLPGMYVNARIHTTASRSMAVPESALVKEGGTTFLLVQTNKEADKLSFEKRAVETGTLQNGWVQLMDDQLVSTDELILVEGAFNLIGID
jgi:cobalt-zinc-cadmium efflux system membrane fusion protein